MFACQNDDNCARTPAAARLCELVGGERCRIAGVRLRLIGRSGEREAIAQLLCLPESAGSSGSLPSGIHSGSGPRADSPDHSRVTRAGVYRAAVSGRRHPPRRLPLSAIPDCRLRARRAAVRQTGLSLGDAVCAIGTVIARVPRAAQTVRSAASASTRKRKRWGAHIIVSARCRRSDGYWSIPGIHRSLHWSYSRGRSSSCRVRSRCR